MNQRPSRGRWRTLAHVMVLALGVATITAQQGQDDGQSFRFRSAVELVNVTVTVTDSYGRFVRDLRREDFRVFEDGEEQPVTHFSNERVPVSLGIALDTSGSMAGEKMAAAKEALYRFLFDLLDRDDEVFLYAFATTPELVEGWTTSRQRLQAQLRRLVASGGTAMYDAVAAAVPLAQSGHHRKKALLIISDGNDRDSETTVAEVKRAIRDTDLLVYAIGIDGQGDLPWRGPQTGTRLPPQRPSPFPFPFPLPSPGRRVPPIGYPSTGVDDRVDAAALREITDDSGGRTEIISGSRDLDAATQHIADELSRQYSLGYPATRKRDGRWHALTVDVRGENYSVRARRGYVATP